MCKNKIYSFKRNTFNEEQHNTAALINNSLAFVALLFFLEEPRTDGG